MSDSAKLPQHSKRLLTNIEDKESLPVLEALPAQPPLTSSDSKLVRGGAQGKPAMPKSAPAEVAQPKVLFSPVNYRQMKLN